MRKQMKGQISLFDYMSEDDNKIDDIVDHVVTEDKNTDLDFGDSGVISLYQECTDCWCSTCRHNAKGKAVSRDFAGEKKPCPSCDFCVRQKKAEICEIGSYENGCKLRAKEEGIISE
jgi:hypothetical protein